MSKSCVTHHFACDCREATFSELKRDNAALEAKLKYESEHNDMVNKSILILNDKLKGLVDCLEWYASTTAWDDDNSVTNLYKDRCVDDSDLELFDEIEVGGKRARAALKEYADV